MAEMVPSLERLIEQFRRLPAIGRKTAVRLAFSVLDGSDGDAQAFADAILDAKKNISACPCCQGLTEGGTLCDICADESRDRSLICVVEDYRAMLALERVRDYHGLYHVLHGALSPIDGIGPDQLRIKELLSRLEDGTVKEIILATDPDVEGESTALYLTRLIRPLGVRVSRLAYGMSVGSDLEYTDEGTLLRAIEGRRVME